MTLSGLSLCFLLSMSDRRTHSLKHQTQHKHLCVRKHTRARHFTEMLFEGLSIKQACHLQQQWNGGMGEISD